jgi:hypothetical protein
MLRSGGEKLFNLKIELVRNVKLCFFFIYVYKNEFKSSCPIYQIPLQKLRGGNLCKYMKMYFFPKREKPYMQIFNLSAKSSIIPSFKKNDTDSLNRWKSHKQKLKIKMRRTILYVFVITAVLVHLLTVYIYFAMLLNRCNLDRAVYRLLLLVLLPLIICNTYVWNPKLTFSKSRQIPIRGACEERKNWWQ